MPSRDLHRPFAAAALLALCFAAATSEAASPDAWIAFRKDVEAACLTVAAPLMSKPQIVVDPFGSESYGIALLNGMATDTGAPRSIVCIYDKAAKRAEIGGTMALETAVPALLPEIAAQPNVEATTPIVAEPRPGPETDAAAALSARFLSPPSTDVSVPPLTTALATPAAANVPSLAAGIPAGAAGSMGAAAAGFAGQCEATCAAMLASLAEPDRDSLLGLAEAVKRTLDRNAAASLAAGPAKAREAALAVAASTEGDKAGVISAPTADLVGEGSCVLYYYGYSNEASRTVGRHRCAVTKADDGALVVEKLSGERLRAEIKPLTSEVSAFVGRTFGPGQKERRYDREKPVDDRNDDLGNTVGFAAENDGGLLLVSSQRRKFESADAFFWVLALDRR